MKTEKIIASVIMASALSITTVFPIGLSEMNTNAVSVSGHLSAPVTYENDDYSFGDVNGDKLIDSNDATGILAEYSALSIGGKGNFNENQKKSADIDKNNIIDSSDATLILAYYSYTSTGGKLDMQSYLDEQNSQQTETTTTSNNTTTSTKSTTTNTAKTTTSTKPTTTTKTTVTTTSTAIETTTTTNPKKVSEIRLTRNEFVLKVGTGELSAYVTMLPSTALDKSEKWSSSNEEIAVVDNEGWVFGKKAGECDITVQSVDNPAVSAVIHVTVYENEPPVTTTTQTTATTNNTTSSTTTTSNVKVTNIILSKYEMTVPVGKKDISMVTMLPYEATNKDEIWISSNESIATVDKYGWVKGVSVGECTVTVYSASNPEIKAEIAVKIVDANTDVPEPDINFSHIIGEKSDSKNIAFCTPLPKNASGRFVIDYVITDSDGNVSTITSSIILAPEMESVITMLTADTNYFTVESYITNLSTNQRAKIGKYKLCLNPRDTVSTEEDINFAFSAISGISQ